MHTVSDCVLEKWMVSFVRLSKHLCPLLPSQSSISLISLGRDITYSCWICIVGLFRRRKLSHFWGDFETIYPWKPTHSNRFQILQHPRTSRVTHINCSHMWKYSLLNTENGLFYSFPAHWFQAGWSSINGSTCFDRHCHQQGDETGRKVTDRKMGW